ncbi:hypothetical protein [Leisingera sp. M658]|uniref:hypothetical protein n=1 Tax=Leisingera sp. M658 TaxID=2867015 RepID=UPI0021A7FC41|nr:hypothetical protein [Leisingera sp. M658]UWQ77360.1 hypothetical protein K3724_22760 [Leisingera sp. M658]
MKFLIVESTRKTKIGTFRPGILYSVDETKPNNQAVLLSLTEGKDASGRKVVEPVGNYLSKAEADQFRKDRAQQAAKERGGERGEKAEGKGAVNTANLTGLTKRAERAEAEVQRLEEELQAEKDKAFALDVDATKANETLAEERKVLKASEDKVTGLTAEVVDLKDQLNQTQAALDAAHAAAAEAKAEAGKGKSK